MYISLLHKLPAAAAVLIPIAAAVIIYVRSKNVTQSEFLNIFKSTKYIRLWMLIAAFVLTAMFGVFNYIKSKDSVYAVVTLNYSEASQAQNSNGTRYNMAEIICDEVIEKAIEKGAFEEVSVKDLKKCLSVRPYVQGGANDKSEYHISTEFIVEYHASAKTRRLDAENVIKLITSSYKEYYIEKYIDNFKLGNISEKPDFNEMEYMDIAEYLNKEATVVLNYLYGMAEKGSSFVTKNNTTFGSIAGKVYQFRETHIEHNLKSLILQYGIVRDRDGYTDRLSYQNSNTDFDRRKNEVSFNLCNQAIARYSEEMTRIVLVPTWDEGGKYYMGRTKVGIDELSVKATKFSNDVAAGEKEIMDNNLVISKMQGSPGNSVSSDTADPLIESIDKGIKKFADEAIAAGREYSNYRMNQCIAVSISGNSIFGELKKTAVFAVLVYAALMLLAAAMQFPKKE